MFGVRAIPAMWVFHLCASGIAMQAEVATAAAAADRTDCQH